MRPESNTEERTYLILLQKRAKFLLLCTLFNQNAKAIAQWESKSLVNIYQRMKRVSVRPKSYSKLIETIEYTDVILPEFVPLIDSGSTVPNLTDSGCTVPSITDSGLGLPEPPITESIKYDFLSNINYVKRIIISMNIPLQYREELRQEAYFIWIKEAPKWNPEKAKFYTFMGTRLRQRLYDYLREIDPNSRIMRRRAKAFDSQSIKISNILGFKPPDSIIHEITGISPIKARDTVSFEEVLYDPFIDERGRQLQPFEFETLTKELDFDEKVILYLYFMKDKTLKDIGYVLNLSESRVSQVYKEIKERLRRKYDLVYGRPTSRAQ